MMKIKAFLIEELEKSIKKRPESYKKVWPAFEKYVPLLDIVDFEEKEKYYKVKELLIKLSNEVKVKL